MQQSQTQKRLSDYIDSSGNDPGASAQLLEHLSDPLRIDFANSYPQLSAASTKPTGTNPELAQALSKTRLYAFIVQDAPDPIIPFDDESLADHVLSRLTDAFSSTLFQPPPALHMNCSDAIADHWMSKVVTPAYEQNGLADPFLTLSTIIDLPWHDLGVCDECVAHRRKEWKDEAITLWENMDTWMSEKN